MKKSTGPNAMAFYQEGFIEAFNQAREFSGPSGRIATLPDLIQARLDSKPGDPVWEDYFTTMTAEYVGYSERTKNPIVIVAHGIGPMSTREGILKAYAYEFMDGKRNKEGGRITVEEFHKLERGEYGPVSVIDLEALWARRDYPFSTITAKEVQEEPLWQARLGSSWEKYIERHTGISREWEVEQGKSWTAPCILAMDDARGCSYGDRILFERQMEKAPGMALAHLLSLSQLLNYSHEYFAYDYSRRQYRNSLVSDVGCYGWGNGTRFVAIRNDASPLKVHPGLPNYTKILKGNLDKLWQKNPKGKKEVTRGFWHLLDEGGMYFTDIARTGDGMADNIPEFFVTKMEEIKNGPASFRTGIVGYHLFFRYDVKEVQDIAPPGANAFSIGDIKMEWDGGKPTHHVAEITFYKISVDTTQRLTTQEEIYQDYNLMMSLMGFE